MLKLSTHSDELSCSRFNDAKFVVLAGDCEPTAVPVPRTAQWYVGKVDVAQYFAHADVPDEDLVI